MSNAVTLIPILATDSVIQQDPAPKSRTGKESISAFMSEIIAPKSCSKRPVCRPFRKGSQSAGLDISSRCVLERSDTSNSHIVRRFACRLCGDDLPSHLHRLTGLGLRFGRK